MAGLGRRAGCPGSGPDLAALEGYHSPRSTSTSASTPTSRRCRRPRRGGATWPTPSVRSTSTAIPTGRPPHCARALADEPRRRRRRGVLRQRLQRGPPVPAAGLRRDRTARWPCSSPPTPCTATSPGSPGRRWPPGRGATTSPSTSTRWPTWSTDADPVLTFLCSPNNPTGRADRPRRCARWPGSSPGLLVVDEAYGQFAPSSRPGPAGRRTRGGRGTWWSSAPSPRRGRWPGPGSATWWPTPRWSPPASSVALPYHLDAAKQVAGRLALALRRRDGAPGGRRRPRSGAGSPRPSPSSRSRRGPRTPTSCCSAPRARRPGEVWADLVEARCSCETVPSGRASPGACG